METFYFYTILYLYIIGLLMFIFFVIEHAYKHKVQFKYIKGILVTVFWFISFPFLLLTSIKSSFKKLNPKKNI